MERMYLLLIFVVTTCVMLLVGILVIRRRRRYISASFSLGLCPESDPYKQPLALTKLFTQKECQDLMRLASPQLVNSQVLGKGVSKSDRISQQAWIPISSFAPAKRLKKRMETEHNLLGAVSKLQVVKYKPGGFYGPHHDQCFECTGVCAEETRRLGPRYANILLYLNDGFTGGATRFPNLKRDFKPRPGDGLLFHMMNNACSQVHPHGQHAGMPLKSGEKWIANIWFRKPKGYLGPSSSCTLGGPPSKKS